METYILNATDRQEMGNQVGALRRKGLIPAVVYGHGIDSYSVTLDAREFGRLHTEAGESALVDLVVDGKKPVKVLIQSVQRSPVRNEIIHTDLRAVRMDEKLETYIEFEFVGESPAVKALGAVFIRNMDGIDVKCLPTALVHSIKIDLGSLKEYDDVIKVGDITPPEGVEFLAEPDDVIAVVSEPAAEETAAGAPEANVEAVKVVGEEEKKAEGEQAA